MSAQHTPTVTQADREAGAAYWAGQGHHGSAEQCRTGKGFTYTAEAFARHREQSQAELLAALDKYADDLCEGWCEKSPDCAHFDDCAGCLARRTAWKARGVQP